MSNAEVTHRRYSVYMLMDDRQLEAAVVDLERMVAQLEFARSPVASKLRDGYEDALAQAQAELERRKT